MGADSRTPATLAALAQSGFEAALRAVTPRPLVQRAVHPTFASAPGDRQLVIAIGKAAAGMLRGYLDALPAGVTPTAGVLASPVPMHDAPPWLEAFVGGHPSPNAASFAAARRALELVASARATDRVDYLVSGGGSAAFELPAEPTATVEQWNAWYAELVRGGEPIDVINAQRAARSAVKGGRLAAAQRAGSGYSWILSDVAIDHPEWVASGPTYAAPPNPRHVHRVLASSEEAVAAAAEALRAEGVQVVIDSGCDDWPVDDAVNYLWSRLVSHREASAVADRPVAVVSGGEVTVRVTGSGRGGRNQAFVLRAVPKIAGHEAVVLSAGTDGIDGNSPAAGAWADGATESAAMRLDLDRGALDAESDSYSFFQALGHTVEPGPTGTNVRDIRILIHA